MSSALDALLSVCNAVTEGKQTLPLTDGRQTPPPKAPPDSLGTPPRIMGTMKKQTVYSITSKRLITIYVTMPLTPPRCYKLRGISNNGVTIIRKKYTCQHGPMRRDRACKNCSNPKWRVKCANPYTVSYTHSECAEETTVKSSLNLLQELDAYKADSLYK